MEVIMIYITGDVHRDFSRIEEFCEEYDTTTDDILIILGDAGINYYCTEADQQLKEELAQLPIILFCIHGNHEEYPYNISTYQEKIWHEGLVFYEEEYPNILFASDGEIYDFDGKKAITIGGAYSVDKYYRLRVGEPWFDSEQLDEQTKALVESRIEAANHKVDFVFSHTGPLKFVPVDEFMPTINQNTVDQSMEKWLDYIEDNLDYERWFFGLFHCERIMGRIAILYQEIEDISEFC